MWFNRLKTRVAYVQGAEKGLEERREHCELSRVEDSFCCAANLLYNRYQSRQGI